MWEPTYMSKNRQRAFSVIEWLVVISIIAMIIAILLPLPPHGCVGAYADGHATKITEKEYQEAIRVQKTSDSEMDGP